MYDHLRYVLEHGANVMTIEEESFFPWWTAPALADTLDELAKRHGVTIMGSGAQDLYWMTLPCALMGAAHRVDSVHGRTIWNVDDYGPEVAQHVHAGSHAPGLRVARRDRTAGHRSSCAIRPMRCRRRGPDPAEVQTWSGPCSPTDTPSRRLGRVIAAGRLLGVTDTVTITSREGPSFTFEQTGCVYRPGQSDLNEWVVRGEPAELKLRNDNVPTRSPRVRRWSTASPM